MAEYETGKTTKQKILESAASMFWQKGYSNTRYNDFARKYDINPGLIHYHYKKKRLLGEATYLRIIEDTIQNAKIIVGDDDDILLQYAIITRIFWKYIEISPEFSRFLRDIIIDRIAIKLSTREDLYWYRQFNKKYELGIPDCEMDVQIIMAIAGELEFILAYMNGDLDIAADDCARLDIQNTLRSMYFSDSIISHIIGASADLLEQYNIAMEKEFHAVITKKRLK